MASNGVFYSGGTGGTGLDLTSGDVTRINISTGGVIKFNNDYTFPTSDGSANTVLLTNGSGSLSFSTIPNASLDNSSITIGSTSVSLGGTASSIAGLTSITADTIYANNVLRISQNGDGLRMTNVGAFDNDGSNNFRIFSNNDLILSTNGDSGTAVTFDSSSKDATFQGQVIGSFSGSGANLNSIPNSSLDNSSLTVAAGSGLANGGLVSLGGSVTLNVGAGTGIVVNANDVALDYAGTNNFIDSATNLEGTSISALDTIVYHDATDNNVKKGLVSDLPFTNNNGTVTSVAISGSDGIDVDSGSPITTSGTIALGLSNIPNTSLANSSVEVVGGNGLTGGGTAALGGSVTLNVGAGTLIDVDGSNVNVDLSELATSTSNGDGDYFVVVDTANAQKKLTKGNINISGFNNDAGYITSAGNTNIYNTDGSLSEDRILNQAEFLLDFRASANEYFQVFKSNSTPIGTPRVRFEADDAYDTVLELHSSNPSTFIVQGYDAGQSPVFNVDGQGNLFAVSKSFLIEHPSDSSMSLRHGSLEGPEHGVYVRGKLDGSNTIELPSYWLDLVDEDSITVQLTPIGSHQNLYVKDIVDNKVIVANSALLSSKVKCFYFVQAERKDIDKMIVEYPKGTQTI